MLNPNPPIPAPAHPSPPRPAWALVGLVALVALVVTPLVVTVRAGLADPVATTAAAAPPPAEFASATDGSGDPAIVWPTAEDLDRLAAAVEQDRWERLAAAPPEPAPAPAPEPAPVPAVAPAPAPAPVATPEDAGEATVEAPAAPGVPTDSVWDALAVCESSGNWAMNSGNGFYGGIQFMHSTWVNMGGRQWAEYPHQATREQQIEVATRLQAQYGWGQWPACSARLGLR